MAVDSEPVSILTTSIEEQRRLYDTISNIYDQLRLKALALIAGEVAIISFLFSGWNFHKILIGSDRIFFFFVGIITAALAFSLLLWIVSTVPWKVAHNFQTAESWLADKNNKNYQSFLKTLHNDYCNVNEYCSRLVNDKCKKFNWSVFLLSGGIIILMVIKYGGPQK